MPTPVALFLHDCAACAYLGTVASTSGDHGFADLYACETHGRTVISRFGNDGPDYSSAPVEFAGRFGGDLAIAATLATPLVWR